MRKTLYAIAALAAFASAAPLSAQYAAVTTRGGIGGTGLLDWGALGAENTVVPSPTTTGVPGIAGLNATVSEASGSLERRNQNSGWAGNFTNGDRLLWTTTRGGPLTILFNSSVFAVGANYMTDNFGAFTGQIEAFNSSNISLGIFGFSGNATSANDGTAIFAGVSSTLGDIRKITITGLTATNNPNDFAINQLSVRANANTTVPEPMTIWLTGAGLGIVGVVARRRRKTA
jgi:hypothetical protein